MDSPLYYPIVGLAKQTMLKTAESSGIDWKKFSSNLKEAKDWKKEIEKVISENPDVSIPPYYKKKFHGYFEGNLCLEAAVEQELAGKAVGARNFPQEGSNGEEMLRSLYDEQIKILAASLFPTIRCSLIVDLGCGTGTSTKRLANLFPEAAKIIGFDLSPQMVAVGRFLLSEEAKTFKWVTPLAPDERITLKHGDAAATGLPSSCASLVSLSLVLHELPEVEAEKIFSEAYRILKPGGQLIIIEMDPSAPGYVKLRKNPWLFSILRSTEPYLDEYFDSVAPSLLERLRAKGFSLVQVRAATGRHLALAALKGGIIDSRPSDSERLAADMHMNTLKQIID